MSSWFGVRNDGEKLLLLSQNFSLLSGTPKQPVMKMDVSHQIF